LISRFNNMLAMCVPSIVLPVSAIAMSFNFSTSC
jgi:hypothetical protein